MSNSSSKKPVVVYGASGYTGRLVCEYLREYDIPFIAAGRSADKLHAAMKSNVAGIETASYEVVEVIHTTEALTQLFKGASVVLNTVGPFAKFGPEVVRGLPGGQVPLHRHHRRAGLADHAGPGIRRAASPRPACCCRRGWRRCTPPARSPRSCAWRRPGLDTLDIAVFWGGSPTIASTQTILVNAAMAKAYYLEQNQYVEWQPDAGLYSLTIPGQHEAALALPWGGTSHPVWFKRDPRVANVKVLGGVFNKPLMLGVPQIVAAALKATEGMNADDRYAALAKTAAGVMNSMPPRENPRINKSVDSVHASGPLARAHCVIFGNCNYKQTGLLQAYAAASLLQQAPKRVGFASGCQAFGHHELLGTLRSFGLVQTPVLTVHR